MNNIDSKLSERMKMVAGLLSKGKRVADIGCDHAFVSMYLLRNEIATRVLALDLREGPLKIAGDNIRAFGYENLIETRLSDGFEMIDPDETDAAIIAGMGGPLIVSILESGMKPLLRKNKEQRPSVITEGYELVIQPQSELDQVRAFLRENGFAILDEAMTYEEGKYYTAIKIVKSANSKFNYKNDENSLYTDLYGDVLVKKKDTVFKDFLTREREKKLSIIGNLDESISARNADRKSELESEIKSIDMILKEFE